MIIYRETPGWYTIFEHFERSYGVLNPIRVKQESGEARGMTMPQFFFNYGLPENLIPDEKFPEFVGFVAGMMNERNKLPIFTRIKAIYNPESATLVQRVDEAYRRGREARRRFERVAITLNSETEIERDMQYEEADRLRVLAARE